MATKYAKAAGGNWSASATWSATGSGGSDSAGAPAAGDDVIFQSGSTGLVTVDTTTCVGKTLTCQGSGNQIAFTATKILTISGNVTFISGMTLSGTGRLTINAASSLTSGGVTFPGDFYLSAGVTFTFVDNWTITGLFAITSNVALAKTGVGAGDTITANGGLNYSGAVLATSTIAKIVIGGGVFTGNNTMSVPIDLAGNVSLTARARITSGCTLTYVSGTIDATQGELWVEGNPTINAAQVTFKNVWLTHNNYTLAANLNCTNLIVAMGTALNSNVQTGAFNITCDNLLFIGWNRSSSTTYASWWESSKFWSIPQGQTLTVNNSIQMLGTLVVSGNITAITLLKSGTVSQPIYLNYLGTRANMLVAGMTFTDVDASGSAVPIENMNGGTLTRTTNINNRSWANILDLFGAIV
jgi:hypothetical protein